VLAGHWENFWSSEQACIVRLEDRAAVMDRLVYVATNPVKDYLVERVPSNVSTAMASARSTSTKIRPFRQ